MAAQGILRGTAQRAQRTVPRVVEPPHRFIDDAEHPVCRCARPHRAPARRHVGSSGVFVQARAQQQRHGLGRAARGAAGERLVLLAVLHLCSARHPVAREYGFQRPRMGGARLQQRSAKALTAGWRPPRRPLARLEQHCGFSSRHGIRWSGAGAGRRGVRRRAWARDLALAAALLHSQAAAPGFTSCCRERADNCGLNMIGCWGCAWYKGLCARRLLARRV